SDHALERAAVDVPAPRRPGARDATGDATVGAGVHLAEQRLRDRLRRRLGGQRVGRRECEGHNEGAERDGELGHGFLAGGRGSAYGSAPGPWNIGCRSPTLDDINGGRTIVG